MFLLHVVMFFFFSSRRRHTRYIGDWSSDVCSSDLGGAPSLSHTLCVQSTEFREGAPPPPLQHGITKNRLIGLNAKTSESAKRESHQQIGRASCRERV